MHAYLETPDGMALMASDVPPGQRVSRAGRATSRSPSAAPTSAPGYWNGLCRGRHRRDAAGEADVGRRVGALVDRFGVSWMVNLAASDGAGPEHRGHCRSASPATAASSSSSASPVCTARRWRCGSASRSPMKPRFTVPA